MKNLIKIAAVFLLALGLNSCGVASDAYGNNGNNYPNNSGVYRTGDGSVYRQGDIYRDQNGNVYENGRVIRTGDIYGRPQILNGNGYSNNNSRRLPPGQAKKIYGGNAKDYARGQQNKRNRGFNNDRNIRDNQNSGRFDNNQEKSKNKMKEKRGFEPRGNATSDQDFKNQKGKRKD